MNTFVVILGLVFLSLVLFSVLYFSNHQNTIVSSETESYQGPVRPTDDEAHFRSTGITKPMENKR